MNRLTLCRPGVLASALTLAAGSALAQGQPAAPEPAASAPAMPSVVITASPESDDRREATAAKIVVNRAEMARFGDTNLADVLRRVPGITISKSRGEGTEIRMRGLGSGYTLFTIDGEPAPPGFSLDSLSPDLIERIEVIRTATADQSAQAVAGTINVILRHKPRSKDRGVKVGASTYDGQVSGNVEVEVGEKSEDVTSSTVVSAKLERDRWPTTTHQLASDGAGAPQYARITETDDQRRQWTLGLTSRRGWKWSDARSFSLAGFLQAQHSDLDEIEFRSTPFGAPPAFAGDRLALPNDVLLARVTANLKLDVGEMGQLDQKATVSATRRQADGVRTFFDDPQQDILVRQVDSQLHDDSVSLVGKYKRLVEDAHSLGLGWDAQYTQRSETRVQRESSPVGYPTHDFDQSFTAKISRLALYAQDEVSLSDALSLYAGLRWEGLQTRTVGNDPTDVRLGSSVFSPTVQGLWKIPQTNNDQLRVSLGRTYKAPTAKDLIPRLWVVPDNTPTTPNFQGNPALKPELSWGVDIGWEHYLQGNGFVGVNFFVRHIDDVVLQRLFQDTDGTWVTTPFNGGAARTVGLELELKGRFKDFFAEDAPDGEMRVGLNRNWSRVDQVPGPDNRLNQQSPLGLTVGVDHRPAGMAQSWGASWVYTRGATSRTSATQTVTTIDTRTFDVYGLWKVDPATQWRATVSKMLGPDDGQRSRYTDPTQDFYQQIASPSHYVFKLQLQHSF